MIFIESFREGDSISEVLLCKTKVTAKSKTGKSYYALTLQDKSGTIDAKVWDLSSGIDHFEAMEYIHIDGEVTVFQGANQLNVRRIRRAHEGEFDPADYLPSSPYREDDMWNVLLKMIDSVKQEHLHRLLEKFFIEDEELAKEFRKHSAAKSMHHNFVSGLLQHSVRVAGMCEFYCTKYPALKHDLLITGALLHDIGKTRELSNFPENDYTDEGQLIGHIVIGYEMIASKAREIEGFPKTLLHELEHLIVSHHGELEFGSPKKPALLEAVALNMADNTDAKIEGMSHLLANAVDDMSWLGYQKMFGSNVRKTSGE